MTEFALITGASNGIGYELAVVMAQKGHHLLLVARSEDKLKALQLQLEKSYSIQVIVYALDLSKDSAPEELARYVEHEKISISILINNAGFGDYGYFHEADWGKLNNMIDLNIKSLTHLTHLLLPQMVAAKKGKIMNVASIAAFLPGPLMATYYATKAYVLSLSEALSNELSSYGITVTALCPGPTESGFQQAAALDSSKLMEGRKMPSSKTVAEYGYKAMMQGKAVAVEGFMNKVMVGSIRFTPRSWAVKIVRRMQDKRNDN
jgi:short-subunit dehydrogenase